MIIFPSAAPVDPAQRGPVGEDCVEPARGAHGPQGQDGSQRGAGWLSWRSRLDSRSKEMEMCTISQMR